MLQTPDHPCFKCLHIILVPFYYTDEFQSGGIHHSQANNADLATLMTTLLLTWMVIVLRVSNLLFIL